MILSKFNLCFKHKETVTSHNQWNTTMAIFDAIQILDRDEKEGIPFPIKVSFSFDAIENIQNQGE